MPTEKGPEWDYVKLVEHEGTDGVKQWKNKSSYVSCCMCFMVVPRASGYTSCELRDVGWPSVLQQRTLGWLLMRMRRGRRRGGSRRRSPAVLTSVGRVGLQAKRS
eukprot:1160868-Pelagomonas_calceolata.AAC.1